MGESDSDPPRLSVACLTPSAWAARPDRGPDPDARRPLPATTPAADTA